MELPSPARPRTVFDHALEAYLDSLPKDKRKFKFVDLCRGSGQVTPQAINDLVQSEISKKTLSDPAKRLLVRLTLAVQDFSGVIDQIASVQPLPLAIIWGGLKVVVEGAARCNNMFDLMKGELRALVDEIRHINDYEGLYGDSEAMQELFFKSYTNIISFWHRVHKECKTTEFGSFRRSLTSANVKKLKSIVDDLKLNVGHISKKASIIQAGLDNNERRESQHEREKQEAERAKQNDWRQRQSASDYEILCDKIQNHLRPKEHYDANERRHSTNLTRRPDDIVTCEWLTENADFSTWSLAGPNASSTAKPIFGVSGPAGYGKSILSSFTIQHLQQKQDAAVAYFFCQISAPCDNVCDILRLFALQLFGAYYDRRLPVDADLCRDIISRKNQQELQSLVRELSANLYPTSVYFVIDGLDEAQTDNAHQAISSSLRFICGEMLDNSKLWITLRKQVRRVECFDLVIKPLPHILFEIADHTEADVVRYIDSKFDTFEKRLEIVDEKDRISLHMARNYLKSRAKGHFLWARLMTEGFKDIDDPNELLRHVNRPPPDQLDELYSEFFSQIKPENRKIGSKIIGLIAFSRRQLRIEEVREATISLITRGRKNAKDEGLANMPTNRLLSKFTALVEFNDSPTGSQDCEGYCRLTHSSVLEFLLLRPAILGEERALQITPYTIADACLTYLARPIYAQPLQIKASASETETLEWVDSSGLSMDKHYFVQYAAKYWSRHLEDVEPDNSIQGRVAKFVESKNFQTCMQIQTIWVQGKFDVYYVQGQKTQLRVLPAWFICSPPARGKPPELSKHWLHYLVLLHNWRKLLSCGGCHDVESECPFEVYRGDVDRIWWGSLGSEHLFSSFNSRYTSFSLVEDREKLQSGRGPRFEALIVALDHTVVLRLNSWNQKLGTLEFSCEWWRSNSPSRVPTVQKKQIICTDESSTNWLMFTRHSPDPRKFVARPMMFSATGEYLRIGAQIFFRDDRLDYRSLPTSGGVGDLPNYFEELGSRNNFVAVGCRAFTTANELKNPYWMEEGFGTNLLHFERSAGLRSGEDDLDDEFSEDDESLILSDEPLDDAEGNESWSEGSTNYEGDVLLDSSDSEDEFLELDSNEDESDASSISMSDTREDYDLPIPEDSDDEEDFWGHVIGARLGATQGQTPFRKYMDKHYLSDDNKMVLAVLDTRGEKPKKVFQYTHSLSLMLYDSPPAIHPHHPLVAWPLGAGDVLFADFALKTYFTRKLRASAPHSRHISVKLHFHSGGQFLHMASLEAQLDDKGRSVTHKHKRTSQGPDTLKMFVFLSTYRLSTGKPTRSPPDVIHRVKVDLGEYSTLIPTRLPVTFTWTDEDLYVAQRAEELTVFRISLFANASSGQNVLIPKNKTLLPDTAVSCDTYFVPSMDGEPARIVLGSEVNFDDPLLASFDVGGLGVVDTVPHESGRGSSYKILSPPVGCLLQDDDIGGWVKTDEVPVPKRRGAGNLDRRKERFDPVDDCDVEPYLRFV